MSSSIRISKKDSYESFPNKSKIGSPDSLLHQHLSNDHSISTLHQPQSFPLMYPPLSNIRLANSLILPIRFHSAPSPQNMFFYNPLYSSPPLMTLAPFFQSENLFPPNLDFPSISNLNFLPPTHRPDFLPQNWNFYPYSNSYYSRPPPSTRYILPHPPIYPQHGTFPSNTPHTQIDNLIPSIPLPSTIYESYQDATTLHPRDSCLPSKFTSNPMLHCVICSQTFLSSQLSTHLKLHQKNISPEVSLFKKHNDHIARQFYPSSINQETPISTSPNNDSKLQRVSSHISTKDTKIQTYESYLQHLAGIPQFQSHQQFLDDQKSSECSQIAEKNSPPNQLHCCDHLSRMSQHPEDETQNYSKCLETYRADIFGNRQIKDLSPELDFQDLDQTKKISNQQIEGIIDIKSKRLSMGSSGRNRKKDHSWRAGINLNPLEFQQELTKRSNTENQPGWGSIFSQRRQEAPKKFARQNLCLNRTSKNLSGSKKLVGSIISQIKHQSSQKTPSNHMISQRRIKQEYHLKGQKENHQIYAESNRSSLTERITNRRDCEASFIFRQENKGLNQKISKTYKLINQTCQNSGTQSFKPTFNIQFAQGPKIVETPVTDRVECQNTNSKFCQFPQSNKQRSREIKPLREFSISKKKKAIGNSPINIWAHQI